MFKWNRNQQYIAIENVADTPVPLPLTLLLRYVDKRVQYYKSHRRINNTDDTFFFVVFFVTVHRNLSITATIGEHYGCYVEVAFVEGFSVLSAI